MQCMMEKAAYWISVKIQYNRFHEKSSAVREVEDVRWSGFHGARRDHTGYEKLEEPVSFYFLYTEQMCFLSCITGLTSTCLHLKTLHIDFD